MRKYLNKFFSQPTCDLCQRLFCSTSMNETLFYVRSVAVLIIASCFSDKSRTTKKRFVVVATNAKFTIIDIAVSKNAIGRRYIRRISNFLTFQSQKSQNFFLKGFRLLKLSPILPTTLIEL